MGYYVKPIFNDFNSDLEVTLFLGTYGFKPMPKTFYGGWEF